MYDIIINIIHDIGVTETEGQVATGTPQFPLEDSQTEPEVASIGTQSDAPEVVERAAQVQILPEVVSRGTQVQEVAIVEVASAGTQEHL